MNKYSIKLRNDILKVLRKSYPLSFDFLYKELLNEHEITEEILTETLFDLIMEGKNLEIKWMYYKKIIE